MSSDSRELPIAIIGAGFAGIGTAIQLRRAGIESFTIFERAGEVGGTWRDNTYPGAACDVPSHAYSLSFEPTPTWHRKFAEAGEIQDYILGITDKWELRDRIRLNTEITGARFDEADGSWTLTTGHGETFTARVVVSCVGGLVDPTLPDIEGLASFEGEVFHTARWNHEYDLSGRRVAVIGTGRERRAGGAERREPGRAARRLPTHRLVGDAEARQALLATRAPPARALPLPAARQPLHPVLDE